MNNTITLDSAMPVSSPAAVKPGFYERLFMLSLKPFVHGGLRMTLPDGRVQVLGEHGAKITAEMHIRSREFFKHCALFGNVGFGEAYVDGEWETDDIAAVVEWFILNLSKTQGSRSSSGKMACVNLLNFVNRVHHLLRPNSVSISRRNIAEHYDLGNEFYSLWLDETMTYSAARFEHPGQPLADAQHSKYEELCQKLQLKPGDHVLEIGCGWGSMAIRAVQVQKPEHID